MVDSDNGQILAAYFLIKCGSSKTFLLLMVWSFTNLYVIFTTVSYYMLYVLEVSRFSYSSTFICYLDLQHITNHLKLTEVCRLRSVIYYLFFSFERYSDCQRKFNFEFLMDFYSLSLLNNKKRFGENVYVCVCMCVCVCVCEREREWERERERVRERERKREALPNVASKPVDRSRWNSMSRILLEVSSAFFFIYCCIFS